MKTFTIDNDNNISVFATSEEAAATTTTPFDSFSNQKELTQLAGSWPAERLVAVWNSLPGVKPVKEFKSAKTGASRIWERIQGLGEPEKAKAEKKAKGGAQGAKGAAAKSKSGKAAKSAKSAPKTKKAAKSAKAESGPREGTKTAQVVALLQRKNGATLPEIMEKMGWARHSVRGLIAGALKKAGYTVESFKPEGGERTYRIQ